MRYLGGFLLFLLLGVLACYAAMVVIFVASGQHGSFGPGPLLILDVAVPTWIISFVLCYSVTVSNPKVRDRAFAISALVGFALTIFIPAANMATKVYSGKKREQQIAAFRDQLRSDPEIGLRERWDTQGGDKMYVLHGSLTEEHPTPYTEDLLGRMFDAMPAIRDSIFFHPAWSSEALSKKFDWVDSLQPGFRDSLRNRILRNRNTSKELLERVADSDDFPKELKSTAASLLKYRERQALDPRSKPRVGPTPTR